MKTILLSGLVLVAGLSSIAQASVVTVTYDINISQRWDNPLQSPAFTTFSGVGSAKYDDSYAFISNSPNYTNASFGLQTETGYQGPSSATVVTSPVTQYIPLGVFDHVNTNVSAVLSSNSPQTSYASINTFAAKEDQGLSYRYYQNVMVPILGNDLDGDGISDFGAVNQETLVSFWNSQIGKSYGFSETYFVYETSSNISVFNQFWNGDFTIRSVSLSDPLPGSYPGTTTIVSGYPVPPVGTIPEPSTIALMIAGLALLTYRYNRKV